MASTGRQLIRRVPPSRRFVAPKRQVRLLLGEHPADLSVQNMDCNRYLSNYLSAHADCQLTIRQRRVAGLHVRRCRVCQCCLFEERSLKALVRHTLRIVRTPLEVEMRIRSQLLREPVYRTATDRPLNTTLLKSVN